MADDPNVAPAAEQADDDDRGGMGEAESLLLEDAEIVAEQRAEKEAGDPFLEQVSALMQAHWQNCSLTRHWKPRTASCRAGG